MNRRSFIKSSATLLCASATTKIVGERMLNTTVSDHVVLITGAGSGFGQHMALTFARHGYKVYATMRDPQGRKRDRADYLRNIANNEGLSLYIRELDVTNYQQATIVVEEIIAKEKRIDFLINNAGILIYTPMEIAHPKLWELQMNTNVIAPMNLVGLVQPHMRYRKTGLIIQISSRVGRVIIPGIGMYSMSKSTLETATEAAYYEATPQNIDFVIIQPSAFHTDFNANARKIYKNFSLPILEQERPWGTDHYRSFLEKLDRDFAGTPTRNPQEVADLALNIAQTPSHQRVLRYTVGDDFELNAVRELNQHHTMKQKDALRESGYAHLYRI